MALTANQTRAIRALRAGPLTFEQAQERWASGAADLYSLIRAGLAEKVGEEFRITPAGRAACPPVNPLLAALPAKPKETAMLTNCNSYKDVVAAIAAAGPSGLTRKQLADRFAADSRAELTRIDAHVSYALTRIDPPAIAKIKPGHYVAAEFAPETETVETKLRTAIKRITAPATAAAGIPEEEVEKHARDYAEMIDFDLEAAQSVDLTAADGVDNALPRDGGVSYAVIPDLVCIDDARLIEFGIFSTGWLEIHTENGTVKLAKGPLDKLRRFLGLFAEEA